MSQASGLAYVFRRPQTADSWFVCNLYEIDTQASYHVWLSPTFARSAAPTTLTGAQLAALNVSLPTPASSLLIEYEQQTWSRITNVPH